MLERPVLKDLPDPWDLADHLESVDGMDLQDPQASLELMATPVLSDPLDPSDLKDPQASLVPLEPRAIVVLLDPRDPADLKDLVVWLERLELPESVVPKVPLVLTEFPVRKERKVILELLVPLDSPVLVVFKEKSEIPVQWVLRVLRALLDIKVSVVPSVKRDHKETRDLRALLVSLVDLVHRENAELSEPLVSLVPKDLRVLPDQEVCQVALVLVALKEILVLRDPRVLVETKVPWVTLESLDLPVQLV